MIALDLITPGLAPLQAQTHAADALLFMNHWNVGALPVWADDKPLGLILVSDLMEAPPDKAIQAWVKSQGTFIIFQNAHIFDVLRLLGDNAMNPLAVLNDQGHAVGVITAGQALHVKMQRFNGVLKGNVPVGMLSIQMKYQDYYLSEIARIAESNNCKILDIFLHEIPDDVTRVQLDLLFDRPDLKNVLATFERFGYQVTDTSMSQEDWAEIQDRFNALIRYLNT